MAEGMKAAPLLNPWNGSNSPAPRHGHGERPQRVQYLHGSGMLGDAPATGGTPWSFRPGPDRGDAARLYPRTHLKAAKNAAWLPCASNIRPAPWTVEPHIGERPKRAPLVQRCFERSSVGT